MTRLRVLKNETARLQHDLTERRREQRALTQAVGRFLTATNRARVQMGDLVVEAQTRTVSPRVNILTGRAQTAAHVLTELGRVGVTISPEQWANMVRGMVQRGTRVRQDVRLLQA
jgi:hypothetical protein